MARNKELAIVVLDVGPHMSPHLPAVRKSIFMLAETKLLNHPSHEVAVILFGTTDTKNEVYAELTRQDGEQYSPEDAEQYKHISVLQPLRCPEMECLQRINSIACGRGVSDHVSALLVGLDLYKKAAEERKQAFKQGKRRLLLISSFDTEVVELDAELRDQVAEQLAANSISLEVYGAADGAPARSEAAAAHRSTNLAGLHELLAQSGGTYTPLPREMDMCAMFPTKETAGTGKNATLTIGNSCRIQVQVFKKTTKTNLPTLSLFNPPTAAAGGSGKVTRESEHRDPLDKDRVLSAEEKYKSYRYGQHLIPVENDSLLEYKPGKCMELLGFTDKQNVPRWHYTDTSDVAVATSHGDAVALSALVHGLKRLGRVAIIRYCAMDKGNVCLMAGTPLPAPPTSLSQQDALLLNKLPYKDDLKQLLFSDFTSYKNDPSKQHLTATKEQEQAMQQLVNNLRLAPTAAAAAAAAGQSQATALSQPTQPTQYGSSQQSQQPQHEQLVPESTLNPMLQRFYWFIGQRALDPQFQVPDASEDVLAAAVLDQLEQGKLPPVAQQVTEALPKLFPIMEPAEVPAAEAGGGAAGAAAVGPAVLRDEGGVRAVTKVETDQPVETFNALLDHGQADKAFSGMQAAIMELMTETIGSRQYQKALDATQALRAAAVKHKVPGQFNAFLDQLRDNFKSGSKRDWWKMVMQAGVAPLSDAEVEGAGMSKAAALEYVRVHGADVQPAPEPPKEEAMQVDEEEDEFAGMERARADSDEVASEPEVVLEVVLAPEEPAAAPVEEQEVPVETPAQPVEPEPATMPQKLSEADVEAVKQEIVQEMIDKLSEIEGAILPEVTTAPYDPRFPTTNQNRHCFIRYNEFYKCKFERGAEDQRCLFYKRAYQSLCPPEWLEEWEELRDQGLWFGKY